MGEEGMVVALHDTMFVMLKLGAPVLLSTLVVGVIMAFVQAVTQINEATLAFVPKALVIVGALALAGPFMLTTMTDYTRSLIDQMIAVGGQ